MKKILTTTLALLLTACAGSGGSSAPTAGIDLSGTYSFQDIECYNSSLTAQTLVATATNGFTKTVVVNGSTATSTYHQGACTVVSTATVTFTGNISMNITNQQITSATGGSCTVTLTLNNGQSDSATYSTGQTFADKTGILYLYSSTNHALGLLSSLTDGSGGPCFYAYQKQ